MAKSKQLVKGQNKDDQGEYSKAVQAVQMNSEQKPSDSKLPSRSAQGEVRGARKILKITRKGK